MRSKYGPCTVHGGPDEVQREQMRKKRRVAHRALRQAFVNLGMVAK